LQNYENHNKKKTKRSNNLFPLLTRERIQSPFDLKTTTHETTNQEKNNNETCIQGFFNCEQRDVETGDGGAQRAHIFRNSQRSRGFARDALVRGTQSRLGGQHHGAQLNTIRRKDGARAKTEKRRPRNNTIPRPNEL
jgi:hypothetical protein